MQMDLHISLKMYFVIHTNVFLGNLDAMSDYQGE